MLIARELAHSLRHRFGGFAVLSGLGWVVDFCVYSMMTLAHVGLFFANIAGAGAGMATVFFGARLSVFRDSRVSLRRASGWYAGWSVIAVLMASLLIAQAGRLLRSQQVQPFLVMALTGLHLRLPVVLAISIVAKLVITPLTMLLNFCAMTVINGHRTTAPPRRTADHTPDPRVRADVQLRETGGAGGEPV